MAPCLLLPVPEIDIGERIESPRSSNGNNDQDPDAMGPKGRQVDVLYVWEFNTHCHIRSRGGRANLGVHKNLVKNHTWNFMNFNAHAISLI